MKPTNKLRFVERTVYLDPFYKQLNEKGELVTATRTYRVLQQWWEDSVGDMQQGVTAFGEWRDVPLESEQ